MSQIPLRTLVPLLLAGFVTLLTLTEGVMSYYHARQDMLEYWQRHLNMRMDQLRASLREDLERNDLVAAQRRIDRLYAVPEVDLAVVLNPEGRVRLSGDAGLLGTVPGDVPAALGPDRVEQDVDGQGLFALRALPEGAIRLHLNLRDNLAKLRWELLQRSALSTLIMALCAITLWYLLHRRFTGPVARLLQSIRALSEGDLQARSGLIGRDEIQELGRNFDRMAEQLAAQHQSLDWHRRLYAALSDINQMMLRTQDMDSLLRETCRILVEQAGFRLAWIGRVHNEDGEIRPMASAGPGKGYLQEARISVNPEQAESRGPLGQAILQQRPQVFQLFQSQIESQLWHDAAKRHRLASAAAFPMHRGETVFAALVVYSHLPEFFERHSLELLEQVANDLSYGLADLERRHDREIYEQQLARERSRLRALLDSIPDLIFFKDREFRYLGCNRAFEKLMGRSEGKIIGLTDQDLLDADTATFIHAQDEMTQESNRARSYRNWLKYPDGRDVLLDTLATPYQLSADEVIGLIGVSRDITAQHRVDQALRESEESLRITLDSIADAVIATDTEGHITRLNRMAEKMTGWKREDAVGRPVQEVVVVRDALTGELGEVPVEQVLREGRRLDTFEHTELLGREGQVHKISHSAAPVRNQLGDMVGVVMVLQDVTAAYETEQELRLAASVFESDQGIFITDDQTRIIRINKTFTRITGYDETDALGHTPGLLKSGRHDLHFYRDFWNRLQRKGSWRGEIWNRHKNGKLIPCLLTVTAVKDGLGRLSHYVSTFIDLSEQKHNEQRVQYLAYYDELTGIPNRTLLGDRLQQAIAHARRAACRLALLFIDLDGFKTINDSLGHRTGDRLLQGLAERLKKSVRDADTVARLGGDEFVIVLEDLAEDRHQAAGAAANVAENLTHDVGRPFRVDGQELFVTPSIGIVLFPEDGADTETLLKHADTAMYAAKAAGRNTYRFFAQAMNASAVERLNMELALRTALAQEQFHMVLQPQASMSDNRLLGAEALLRWDHPEWGPVSPAQFIPVAESTGQIQMLGQWVLRHACEYIHRHGERLAQAGCRISVNLSARQFQHPSFIGHIKTALAETQADPALLTLEITESVLVQNPDEVNRKLHELKSLGLRISIDDFGTGYSSLAYLKQFPLDMLKIDRSFVADVNSDHNDAAIVRTVIAMAKGLGLTVIAEGVENEDQLAFLRHEKCDGYQGHLLSQPVEPKALLDMLG